MNPAHAHARYKKLHLLMCVRSSAIDSSKPHFFCFTGTGGSLESRYTCDTGTHDLNNKHVTTQSRVASQTSHHKQVPENQVTTNSQAKGISSAESRVAFDLLLSIDCNFGMALPWHRVEWPRSIWNGQNCTNPVLFVHSKVFRMDGRAN